jgi:hypothetical protein
MQGLGLRIPHQREEIAAQAARGGFQESQRRVGGDGGVHGRAPLTQHLEPDLGGQGMRRRDHALPGMDHRPGGEGTTLRTVSRHRDHRKGHQSNGKRGSDHGHPPSHEDTPTGPPAGRWLPSLPLSLDAFSIVVRDVRPGTRHPIPPMAIVRYRHAIRSQGTLKRIVTT